MSSPSKNSEYLIHGTQIENAIRILQLKKLLANPPKKYKVILADWVPTKQIFTQLIYKDIPNQDKYNPGWGACWLVFSKHLLKDYPFYATQIGGFLDNFQDAFKINTDGKDDEKDEKDKNDKKIKNIIIKSPKGGLSRMPNLIKLKNVINGYCKIDSSMEKFTYSHSHEILFGNDIPLEKYCIAIIANSYTNDKENHELEKLCSMLNIPYHRMEKVERKDRFKPYGLNKFVELIDSMSMNNTKKL